MRRRLLGAGVVLALVAAGLVGCDDWQADCEASGNASGGTGTCVVTTKAPPSSPTATPSASPSTSPSPTASPSSSPTPSPTTSPAAGWPTPDTTGAPVETGLPAGPCSLAAGQTYTGMRFACSKLEVRSGTVIRNSVITGEIKGDPDPKTAGFVVEDSTIIGAGCVGAAAVGNSNYTLRRVHIKGFNDGPRSEGPNVRVFDSLIEVCFSAGGHADGLQVCPSPHCQGASTNTSGLVFHHNRVSHPKADSTGAVFVMGGSNGGRITDNLMSGFSITLRVHGAGYTVTGNRIVDGSWLYEPVTCTSATGLTWIDNRLVDVDAAGYRVTSTGAPLSC